MNKYMPRVGIEPESQRTDCYLNLTSVFDHSATTAGSNDQFLMQILLNIIKFVLFANSRDKSLEKISFTKLNIYFFLNIAKI